MPHQQRSAYRGSGMAMGTGQTTEAEQRKQSAGRRLRPAAISRHRETLRAWPLGKSLHLPPVGRPELQSSLCGRCFWPPAGRAMLVANRAPPWWAGLAGRLRQSAHPGLRKRKMLKDWNTRRYRASPRRRAPCACLEPGVVLPSPSLARWGSRLGYHPRQSSRLLPFFLTLQHTPVFARAV
jgi:hypothetical protein